MAGGLRGADLRPGKAAGGMGKGLRRAKVSVRG